MGNQREGEGWMVQTNQNESERDAGGFQSNPVCLSQCALITLEQSEKHGAID